MADGDINIKFVFGSAPSATAETAAQRPSGGQHRIYKLIVSRDEYSFILGLFQGYFLKVFLFFFWGGDVMCENIISDYQFGFQG